MKTNLLFLSYFAQLITKLEMFRIKFVEKIKTHFVFSKFFFSEMVPFIR
jgi:hypothetical protein